MAIIRSLILEARHLYKVVSFGVSLQVRGSGLLDYSASTAGFHAFLKFARLALLSLLLSKLVDKLNLVS